MHLTIAELAVAVDRTETYIRQHIHRNHLAVVKEGSRVFVNVNEAHRWAQERGIRFRSPGGHTVMASPPMSDRTFRMTVLIWTDPEGTHWNLFTLVRHRRKDAMGPWWCEPNGDWQIKELTGDLHLLSRDVSWQGYDPIITSILDAGILHGKGFKVQYALETKDRCHWAYRDKYSTQDHSLLSPFRRHSAEIREFWSFLSRPRQHWREKLEPFLSQRQSQLARLGFPLVGHSNKVGNLMIARAEDALTCDLVAYRDRTLILNVEANDCTSGSYSGIVWASHSGDEVHRQQIDITLGKTLLPLESEVDSVGFAVFRGADGQCVDLMSDSLMLEPPPIQLNVQTGPTLHLRDRKRRFSHEVNPHHHVSTIRVRADDQSSEFDRRIRQEWLDHLSHWRESLVRKKGDLVRFGPDQWNQAVEHVLGILAMDREPPFPIYFADPYMLNSVKKPNAIRFWLNVFAATTGAPLHLLCGQEREGGGLPQWWSGCPKSVTSHVQVRIFTKHDDGKSMFHDRFLITPKREVLITNSVSGWASDGVTFSSQSEGVYRADAERFWEMDLRSGTADAHVEELC